MVNDPLKRWMADDPLDIERVKHQADLLHALVMNMEPLQIGDVEASGNEGCAVDFWLPEKTGSSQAGLAACVVLVWLAAVAVWLW